ncbi:MAG: FtsX-like permease family protein [Gammaproteobacteria bacterium]|nr:FtsX-like permease family protein [Gammaproteobacteria bacterium]
MTTSGLMWANLWRRKTRTVVTLLSIFVAFVLFAVLAATRQAFVGGVDLIGNERLLTIHKSGLIFALPISYRNRIASLDGVVSVSIGVWMQGYFQEPKNFTPLIAVDNDAYFQMYREIAVPPEQMAVWQKERTGAIIGKSVAARRGWKVGDTVPLRSGIYRRESGDNTWELKISGIYDVTNKAFDTESVMVHFDYLDEARTFGRDTVGWLIVKLKDPSQAARVAKDIDALFANSPRETKTTSEKAFAESFTSQVGDVGAIVTYVVSAVLLSMLIVIASTMGQAVHERTAELAVLKAIGFSARNVLFLVLGESLLLTMFGAALGLGLGYTVCRTLAGQLTQYMPAFWFTTEALLIGIALALSLGLLAGAWPAARAMRMRMVDALREA